MMFPHMNALLRLVRLVSSSIWLLPFLAGLALAQSANQPAPAGERKFSSPIATQARASFVEAAAVARKALLAELETALKNAMTNRDLDEANSINAMKTAISTGATPPPTVFKSLRMQEARAAYDTAVAKAETQYTSGLESAMKLATSSGNLNEANAIQGEIKALRKAPDNSHPNESSDLIISGTGFVIDTLQNGTPAFSNRSYPWAKVPTGLRGWRYAKVPIRTAMPQIIVRAKKKTVLQAIGDLNELPAKLPPGWERTGSQFTLDDPGQAKKPPRVHLFKKPMEAGEEVEMPKGTVWGMLPLLPNE